MTLATSAELRAAMGRKGWNVQRLSEKAMVPLSTLHKTLKGQRAIDVEDIVALCTALGIEPGDLVEAAANSQDQYVDQVGSFGGKTDAASEPVDLREDFDLAATHDDTPIDPARGEA